MTAITDAYATAEEYRQGISPQKTDTSDDTEIDLDLLAVTRHLNNELGRSETGFNKDAAAVTRQYLGPYSGSVNPEAENPWKYARGQRLLYIDELVSVTSVQTDEDGDGTVDTSWTKDTDYQLFPLNADKGPEPRPYTALFIPDWTTQRLRWPPGRLVAINGVWGWPSVPPAIKRACIQLTAILRLESPRATSQINDVGAVLATSGVAQGIIQRLAQNYGRISV